MPHAESPTWAAPATFGDVPLYVNDGLLASDEVAPLRASYPTEPIEVLRERYEKDGYVLLKGVLPREAVLSARASYFTSLAESGVIKPESDPADGIFNSDASAADYPGIGAGSVKSARPGGGTDKSTQFTDLALKAHTEDWYCGSKDGKVPGFCNHPDLMKFVKRFTGWGDATLAVKRTLLRNNTPGNRAIGVHYDQSFMRYGEPTAVTAWVPMGDIKLEGGGLIYMQEGHRLGEEIESDFTAKAEAAGMSEEEIKNAYNANMMSSGFLCDGPADFGRKYGRKWLVSSYEAGDVVLHTPYSIHASTINYDPQGKIRLGTDLRFVNSSRPWDTRWDAHYRFDDGV